MDPVQARHFVRPDLGPNCLQRSSADDTNRQSNSLDPDQADILSGLILVQTVCKGYQQTTLVGSQTVWIQTRPDILTGLIWVQFVCKVYRQRTLVGSEPLV